MAQTFKFASGYSISARDDYNPRLFNLAAEAWQEENPAPEPPEVTKEFKIKGGTKTRTRKQWSDPTFVRNHEVWQNAMNSMVADSLMAMAIDRDSMDRTVIEAARAWSEQTGTTVPSDDLRLYLSVVPGDGEVAELFQWLRELDGPGEALIASMLKMFPSDGQGQQSHDGRLGSQNGEYEQPAVASPPSPYIQTRSD